MKEKETKQKKEKMFDIKVNKKALENFMARFFWYAIAFISLLSFILFIMSTITLCNVFETVAESLYNAWVLIRTPFITNILCIAWFWMIYIFIRLIRE